jgi:hypothetical protein
MLIKVHVVIGLDVTGPEQGEVACGELGLGLERALHGFPEGECIGVDVERFVALPRDEADERGWTE